MNPLRVIACVYAVLFAVVTSLNYIPGLTDQQGLTLVRLARRGRDIVEIAGNHRILVTVLARKGPLPRIPGTTELFEAPIQSTPDRRRVGLDVPVEHLAAAIRALEPAGLTIEHIYDY
jgi:hypothetical protein